MSDLTSLIPLSAAWLLTYALHSTLFLGLAWLVSRRLAKRMPRVEEAVWRFALVAALATASLQLAAGFKPLAGSWSLTTPAVSAPLEFKSTVSQASSPRVAVPDRALRAPSPLRIPAGAAPAGPVTSTRPVSLPVLFVGLWGLGALLLSARWVAGHLLLRRRLRPRPEVVGGNMFSQLVSLLGEAGLDRPVRLTCSSRLSVPIALGVSRREICVPPKALASLAPEEQEGMLAHELAHLVRRDPFWLAFSRILASVLFFQPLNWVAYRRMREISELLCDEWAIGRTGRPLSLARCLAEVAGWSFHPVEAVAAPGMADRPSHLAHRIRRLLDGGRTPERRVHPGWLIAGMIVLLVAVAAAAPGVYAAGAALEKAAQDPEAELAVEEDEEDPIDEEQSLAEHMEELAEDAADMAEDAAELAELDELEDLEPELAELGDLAGLEGLEDLDELAALSDQMAQEIGERSGREAEEIGRRYEQMAREMSERMETQLGPQMRELQQKMAEQMKLFEQSPEMKRLHERAREIAERARPSDEEMARLHAQVEKLRKDGGLSSEERARLREDARRMAERHRMSDEERAELRKLAQEAREMSRKFNEEHRAEIDKVRREVLQQSQALREQIHRQLEADPQYRQLRENARRDREEHRQKMRQEIEKRRGQLEQDREKRREEIRKHREDGQRDREREHRKERSSQGSLSSPDVDALIAGLDHDFELDFDFDFDPNFDPQIDFDFDHGFDFEGFDFEGFDFEYEGPAEAEPDGRR